MVAPCLYELVIVIEGYLALIGSMTFCAKAARLLTTAWGPATNGECSASCGMVLGKVTFFIICAKVVPLGVNTISMVIVAGTGVKG